VGRWIKLVQSDSTASSQGLHVVAVQNPLTSLADDVAATKRAIASQDGPVLLVGHPMEEWLSRRQETIQK